MMKKLLLSAVMLALLVSGAFGAAGNRHAQLFPYDESIAADTAYATVQALTNNFDLAGYYGTIKGMTAKVGVTSWDSDMDSVSIFWEWSSTGNSNWIIADSQEVSAASAITKYLTVDSVDVNRYGRINIRAFGDAAGSATQTIQMYAYLYLLNGDGNLIGILGRDRINVTFTE